MSTKKTILTILLFILCCGVVSAWTGPSSEPPTSNISAPINVGPNPQIKQGIFGVDTGYSIKSPIYYDYPSTSYYLDLDLASVLNDLYTYDDIFVGSSSTDDNANLYIANRIYDWDSTAYYIDPSSTSRFNTINLGGVSMSSWPAESTSLWTESGSDIYRGSGYVGIGTASPSAPLDIAATWETAIEFDGGHSVITVHDGFGNFNIKSGVGDDNIITANTGGSYIRLDHTGLISLTIDESTAVGGTFSPETTLSLDSGKVSIVGDISITSSAKAPIFYDYNNSAYYLNPASTSNLNAATFAGAIGVNGGIKVDGNTVIDNGAGWHRTYGNTGWYNQTYGGGWYMIDSTWVRTYNNKSIYTAGDIRAGASMTAPVFSDLDNTAYYLNPASTSKLNYLILGTDATEGGEIKLLGSGGDLQIDNYNGNARIFTLGTGKYFQVIGGSGVKANSFVYSSDKTLKKDIEIIPDALNKVNKLEGISFRWKDKEREDKINLGVIAQDVEKIFPEVVHTDSETGLKSVEYGNLISPVIEAIKELTKKVDNLFGIYFDQQGQINDLQKQINDLQNIIIQ